MNTNPSVKIARKSLFLQTLFASMILAAGLALVCYMITVEGELGALPLLAIVVGLVWLMVTLLRPKALTNS